MFKLILISGACACAAFGQAPPKDLLLQKQTIKIADEYSFGPIGITAALAGPMATLPGAPYSAQAVTQRVQVLADGNRITHTTTNKVARDSKGRVYREESLPGFGNNDTEPPHLVLIEDPVAGTHITLDSNSKTAMKMTAGQMKRNDEAAAKFGPPPPPPPGANVFFNTVPDTDRREIHIVTNRKLDAAKNLTTTDLGTQTVEGVPAKGNRITHTIPAGEMGNEMPIVITTETWYSPDLKVMVMSKSTDPRMGETTYKLTNLSRSEPDPALFQIPADYTIKDQPGDVLIYKKIEK
jgi:hypothetical protein